MRCTKCGLHILEKECFFCPRCGAEIFPVDLKKEVIKQRDDYDLHDETTKENRCELCGKRINSRYIVDHGVYMCMACARDMDVLRSKKRKSHSKSGFTNNRRKKTKQSKSGCLAFVVVLIIILYLFGRFNASNNEAKILTCGICGRSYNSSDQTGNYTSIMLRNMCKSCYHNYQQMQPYFNAIEGG